MARFISVPATSSRLRSIRWWLALVAILLLVPAWPTIAQELEPRTYANTAIDVNVLGVVAGHSSGNVLLDPAVPIEGLDGDLKYGIAQYLRSFSLLGRSAKASILLPFTAGDWEGTLAGQPATRRADGFGDVRMSLDWNFIGAPAMSADELRNYQQKTIVGASLRVVVPTGSYDETELINLGTNRWSYRLELGASHAMGAWAVEAIGAVWTFGVNDDFLEGNRLEQDRLWVLKTHLIYSFRPGFWAGAGIGYGNGGRTSINGVPRDTYQRNWRFGATLAYPINRNHGISVIVGSGVNQGAGADFDTFALAYRYAWGKKKPIRGQ